MVEQNKGQLPLDIIGERDINDNVEGNRRQRQGQTVNEKRHGAKPPSSNSRLAVLETAVAVLLKKAKPLDAVEQARFLQLRALVLRQGTDTGWYDVLTEEEK